MSVEQAVKAAADLKLRIKFDDDEVIAAGGFMVEYSEHDGDRVKAFVALVELVQLG